ncbi:phospholipase D-like domain-containing protein [Treponema parvum]|uniref:phospholipase D-like domain-containing protein n=1 Tax=Treponema parvum TaxID=138851 RepID=UPI001AEC1361|nr:phospholipase D-like domain-containing protein [Treponema parvum]QTQ15337.1 PLDc N-terminal domain-containing protein [Treponema parvum]
MRMKNSELKTDSFRYKRKVKKGSKKIIKVRRKSKKILTYLLFGRILVILFLLAIQFLFLFSIGRFLNPILSYVVNGVNILSFIFMIFLVNNNSKPEFKLAWMIPVAVIPVFGVLFYIFFRTNIGAVGLRKALETTTKEMKDSLQPDPEVQTVVKHTPLLNDTAWYLQNSGGFPAYMNFTASYFPSGEANYSDIMTELKTAKRFVFIEYFIIGMGKIWDSILEILIKKAKQGVEIRVMYDGIGSMMLLPSGYPEYLGTFGIKAKVFAPLIPILSTHQNSRDHRKIFVIDGRVGYTGGVNIEDEYMNLRHTRFAYWKDTAVKISGKAVKTLTAMFLQTWNLNEKKPDDWDFYIKMSDTPEAAPPLTLSQTLASSVLLQQNLSKADAKTPPVRSGGFVIPYGDDGVNQEDIAENVYCDILNKARWYVHITTPYIILDNTLETALTFAVKRGVEVSILVPAKADHFVTFCIGRTFIKTLIDKGVRVYEYVPGFIHAKMFISDGDRAVIGTINLDYRSLFHHFECGVFIYGNPVIRDMEDDFKLTQKNCREITLEEYKKIPVYQRMIGRIARMFSPLL